jgi:transposase
MAVPFTRRDRTGNPKLLSFPTLDVIGHSTAGYDSDAIRQDLRDRGAAPEIPTKRNRKLQHSVSKPLYALRSRIECFIGHLKEQRRIATRYDKTASSFLGFVLLGCSRIWIRFVHRA